MLLTRKRALVTGSTSGIGLAIAEELARHGCDLVIHGFGDPAAIAALQTRLAERYAVRVRYLGGDVSDPAQCTALAANAEAALGGIDILVNNAGIQHTAPVEQFPVDRWNAILAINLSAAFHLTSALLPPMRARGFGRIVNVASVHGLVGSRFKAAYVAAKHGLIGLTKVVALETAGQGITCNAICPGFVLTPLVESQIQDRMAQGIDRSEAERALLADKQPSGQFTQAEHLGALAVFLCSEAAANLTGASLPVDGAWTAQ